MKKIIVSLCTAALLTTGNYALANTPAADELNELLRGELSAVETYKQAIKQVGTEPGGEDLKKALSNHEAAVKELGELVVKSGGTPSKDSGVWGTWAKTVTGTAKVLGDVTALKALKEGEEHGVKEYQDALTDDDVPANVKTIIKDKYLPNQLAHIESLNRMIDKLS